MVDMTLTRRRQRPSETVTLFDTVPLPLGRVHEFCGTARRTLAAMTAGHMAGPVFWIMRAWDNDKLNPQGLMRFAGPGRFTYLNPTRPEDLLWCMEECLRSGQVPLVVVDLPGPPALTPVRRLHLAAEQGAKASKDGLLPLGLVLTPGAGGAPGVETRWQLNTCHTPQAVAWRLERLRARTAPQKAWEMTLTSGRPTLTHASVSAI